MITAEVEINMVGQYQVKATESGTRCGNHGRTKAGQHIFHANPASVRECYRITADIIAQEMAEVDAEKAYERFLEDQAWEETEGVW